VKIKHKFIIFSDLKDETDEKICSSSKNNMESGVKKRKNPYVKVPLQRRQKTGYKKL